MTEIEKKILLKALKMIKENKDNSEYIIEYLDIINDKLDFILKKLEKK